MSAVLRGGKRQFGGKVAYAGCIRHADPALCAQGSVGRHLAMAYTLGGVPFPDPANVDEWRHTPLWIGNDPTKSISYTQHADALKVYLKECQIFIDKVRRQQGGGQGCPATKVCAGACAGALQPVLHALALGKQQQMRALTRVLLAPRRTPPPPPRR